MSDIPEAHTDTGAQPVFHTRGYQQELLEESLQSNIIIALDTGSGKTLIAVLRIKHEVEREPRKVSWFFAPTVALIEQQCDVIRKVIPVPVCMISGASEPNQWKDGDLWRSVLESHRVIVSTPQVLLDALLHGYVDLGRDISLLVFDEAHHATAKHPYNMIMQQFYFPLDKRNRDSSPYDCVRPMVLGLTASPVYGGNPDAAFYKLEHNLDSIVRSSRMHREELAQYVHKPIFKHVLYDPPRYTPDTLPSSNCSSLRTVIASLNIEDDPSVISLRAQLACAQQGTDEWLRLDQKLSKTIHKADTFTHRGLRDFLRAAEEICIDLGEWAADWYVTKVIEQGQRAASPYNSTMTSWRTNEKSYLLENLQKVTLVAVSQDPENIRRMLSPKVEALIACLQAEEADFRRAGETFSGLVFVTRRDSVIALAEVLSRLPETSQLFRIGCLLGSASSFKRHSFLDVTRDMVKDSPVNILAEFRGGDKNLIVSTSVAEEGIDIQACGSVIRFDPPPNVVAWAQSRGRARRQRSSFIMMLEQDKQHELVSQKWMNIEQQMMALYTDPNRIIQETFEEEDEYDERSFRVPSTGAVVTLDSVTSHLNHFCAVLPNVAYGGQPALYDLDPPDYPEDWHSQQDRNKDLPPYPGPWGATVTLPRCLPAHLRVFSTPREHRTKRLAQMHAAFTAYIKLYQAQLLDDHLMPLMSALEPDEGEEVKKLLADIEKQANTEKVSIQMDPWAAGTDGETWWKAEVVIDGLPALTMLTRNPISQFAEEEMPTIYIPGRGTTRVRVRPIGRADVDEAYLERARTYTYRLFWTLYFARMKPEDRQFAYLFLPVVNGFGEQVWEERRSWVQSRVDRGTAVRLETPSRANANALHEQYGLPTDLALVRPNESLAKALQFVRWHIGPLSDKDEETLREQYDGFPDSDITFPLLQVKEFPQQANFLVPLASNTAGLGRDEAIYLLPRYATVELISKEDLQYAMCLPSILRWISSASTVMSLRDELLCAGAVAQIPVDLLRIAITAPVAQEMMSDEQPLNYQRLETLGDCVLKCMVSTQLYADHPLWHEGYLARRKDHAVSNMQLAKAAIGKGLYKWIIRDRFVPGKWKPRYLSDVVEEPLPVPKAAEVEGRESKRKKQTQELSTKVLADVVEAMLGAAYEHGGFDLATQCAEIFGLGLSWKTLSTHIKEVLEVQEAVDLSPPQLELVERMLGYTFERKALLIQALTHASYNGDLVTMSYERLEFLGDSVLDMIVTNMLLHAEGRNYKPGHMHMRKEATVNSHFLAYFCLKTFTTCETPKPTWSPTTGVTVGTEENKIYLWQCLLHSSHRVLEDQHIASTRFEKLGPEIEKALREKTIYPWAALTSLQAPKFVSDMVESLLGAVFLDSGGSFSTVGNVLRTLGIMDTLERIILRDEIDCCSPSRGP